MPARGKLTLKTQVLVDSAVPPVGIEVPITGELPARKYILDTGPVRAVLDSPAPFSEHLEYHMACTHGCLQEYTLHFLQEPPHGVAHWLQCWAVGPKSDLSLTHTFTPPVEMTVLHNGDMMDPKDACKLLEKGIKWRCETVVEGSAGRAQIRRTKMTESAHTILNLSLSRSLTSAPLI